MKTALRQKKWVTAKGNPLLEEKLVSGLRILPVTARVMANRGIDNLRDAKAFWEKDASLFCDPFLFRDMAVITKRILSAVKEKEIITVYGDYDADGVCGAAVLVLALRKLDAQCRYYLPHRYEEGYGINKDAVDKIKGYGCSLLITVDCGIKSADEIDYAKSLGIDVIITDHHPCAGKLPKCGGILNASLEDSGYPYKMLSGAGTAYKLVEALAKITGKITPEKYLALACTGTIADVVPLSGENRIITHLGLEQLKTTKNPGFVKLKAKSDIRPGPVDVRQVAYRIAPRINAAGRMSAPEDALRLLLTEDNNEAEELSSVLDMNNRKRQKIQQDVIEEALNELELKFNFNKDKVIVLSGENWPAGVVGIAAGRITSEYHRPCIIIGTKNGLGKGSGRSIENFHLLNALASCKDYLREFGGHAYAAGISIEEILIPQFREKINEYADNVLSPADLVPRIDIDTEISFRDISFDLIEELSMLKPYGCGNPAPAFVSYGVEVYREPKIIKSAHLKFSLKSEGRIFEAIGFGMADYISLFDEYKGIDAVFTPHINVWNNKTSIQLQIADMRCAD